MKHQIKITCKFAGLINKNKRAVKNHCSLRKEGDSNDFSRRADTF